MAFTTNGLNELLEGLKTNFTSSTGTLVAKAPSTGNFIAGANIEFGTIANGTMNLASSVELTIPAGNEVRTLSLYTGVVTDQTSMTNATELVAVTFTAGTYNFVNSGTLTVTSYQISVSE